MRNGRGRRGTLPSARPYRRIVFPRRVGVQMDTILDGMQRCATKQHHSPHSVSADSQFSHIQHLALSPGAPSQRAWLHPQLEGASGWFGYLREKRMSKRMIEGNGGVLVVSRTREYRRKSEAPNQEDERSRHDKNNNRTCV